ncbi:MAG: CHASE2 domain-containing protein, partial [Oscillatoriales cyanobacterium C42_A2020_001]|nr:CHASE2 domain-containing protein [Leptolyngbyaceae cyanobacterium C42_A2020_001]
FKEVETLKKLGSHDRIPALLNDFEENHEFYLVQEYIEGRSLSEELRIFHRLDEPQVVTLLRDVLEILEFVHERNVIHRDIKPSNLMRRQRDRRLALIDFGAVKELNTQILQDLDHSKLTIGIATQGYAPSEQLAGKPRFNSDLYALGMTAIQALTGLHPSQLPTHPLTGEVIWRDRVDVSPWLASILDKMVRYHFNQRFQSATDVLNALEQTAQVHPTNMQPHASWDDETLIPPTEMRRMATDLLEVSDYPSPAAPVPNQHLPKGWATLAIGLASLLATGLVAGMRQLGWLQSLELGTFDRMVQISANPTPNPRILVVAITEADIQEQKRFPLSDDTIANAIQRLQQYQPRAIGLDVFRDLPQEPGRTALLSALKASNVIAITNLGTPITPAPSSVPFERVGFNDVVLDMDSVVRRNLLFANLPDREEVFHSFALRLATLYLAKDGILLKPHPRDRTLAQLGQAEFIPLTSNFGGYHNLDDRGYQILMQYRGQNAIQQVSLSDVLKGRIQPEQIQDKIVLIGTTAANAKDLFQTPFSPLEAENPRMPGVMIHAHMVSQFLDSALGEKKLIWAWAEPFEVLWIAGWAIAAGSLAGFIRRRPFILLLAEGLLLVSLLGVSYIVFLQGGWLVVAAPEIAMVISASTVVMYRLKSAAEDKNEPSR